MKIYDDIADIIRSGERFLIVTHVRPDGDAIGSSLALWHGLGAMGKEALVVTQDETPENLRFLPGAETIVHSLDYPERFSACFVLDCGTLERVGNLAEKIRTIETLINVDHHLANGIASRISLNDRSASSTGELLYRLFSHMSVAISPAVANCLYAAMLTDTGGFRYTNTKKETLLIAGELIGSGANPPWLAENIYENNSPVKIALMTKVLGSLEFSMAGRVGSLVVYKRDLEEVGARPEHTEGFVDLPRSVRGVVISILYSEIDQNRFKVSLRSKDKIDVQTVAHTFGGGGHLNAASCIVEGSISAVKRQVLDVIAMVLC